MSYKRDEKRLYYLTIFGEDKSRWSDNPQIYVGKYSRDQAGRIEAYRKIHRILEKRKLLSIPGKTIRICHSPGYYNQGHYIQVRKVIDVVNVADKRDKETLKRRLLEAYAYNAFSHPKDAINDVIELGVTNQKLCENVHKEMIELGIYDKFEEDFYNLIQELPTKNL